MNVSPAFAHLDDPLWLLGLALLPLLAWRYHRAPALGGISYSRLPQRTRGLGAHWRLHLPFYLRLAALGLLFVALARPQRGYAIEKSETEGIDIEVVLDVSGSMAAEDYRPKNRLAVAKSVVGEFIASRPADRLGLVTFAGKAMTRAPLTTDRRMLDLAVQAVDFNESSDGTAIGVALANAAARLRNSTTKTKVILLVTDGANTMGEIDPASAAAVCAGLGIKVYTVGVGSPGNTLVPLPVTMIDPFTRQRIETIRMVHIPVDEELLAHIAYRTGGKFWRATDSASLRRILSEIDRLEKTTIAVERSVRYREVSAPWLWSSLALLLAPLATAAARWTAEP